MATIHIPTPLRAYTNGETKITVSGTTVGAGATRPHLTARAAPAAPVFRKRGVARLCEHISR